MDIHRTLSIRGTNPFNLINESRASKRITGSYQAVVTLNSGIVLTKRPIEFLSLVHNIPYGKIEGGAGKNDVPAEARQMCKTEPLSLPKTRISK